MKESQFYETLSNDAVRCDVCARHCHVKEGALGACNVRKNIEGTLYALNYGIVPARSVDPIEKKPIVHFMRGTRAYSIGSPGCNMTCGWCQNIELVRARGFDNPLFEMSAREVVDRALKAGAQSIAYTYSEPTIFLEFAQDVMHLSKEAGLRNIWVSNGLMSTQSLEAILPYVDAANIDLKGPDNAFYKKHCGGSVDVVLRNIQRLIEAGVHTEVTSLVIPGENDSLWAFETMIDHMRAFATMETPWHITRFFPAHTMEHLDPTPIASLKTFTTLIQNAGFTRVHLGNV